MSGLEAAVEGASRYIIKRPRLTRLLDGANARVLMLVAPAGFGKTILAREWVSGRPHAWYQGVPATSDMAALVTGLAAALSALVPGAGTRALARMHATRTPEKDADVLAELLAEELSDWPADAWLVFDDYQFAMATRASEHFVDILVKRAPMRLLITSRKRPSWATARRVLYGELYELGSRDLAMDHDEAAEVLAHRTNAPTAGLVALAEGWPAVIGLAALTGDYVLPEGDLPEALYQYFAEELYNAASPALQDGLRKLVLAPSLAPSVAEFLLGEDASVIVNQAVHLGFLTGRGETAEFHPLLRTFLEAKASEVPSHQTSDASGLARHLAATGLWDDALLLIERFFEEHLYVELLEGCLPLLVKEARLRTLGRWVELARVEHIDAPIVDLAEAEIAFADALRRKAESLALRAARQFPIKHPLQSRAFFRAGVSAHMDFRNDWAEKHFNDALESATDSANESEAVWGNLMVALDLDRPNVPEVHTRLEQLADSSARSEVRLAIAKFLVAIRRSRPLSEVAATLDATEAVLARITDPHLISSYRSCLAYVLVLMARYEAGLTAAKACEDFARDVRLPFVIAYARRTRAAAELGLRHFGRAKHILDWLDREATNAHDVFLQIEAQLVRTRLLISQGRSAEAAELLRSPPERFPYEGERGEWLATRALALACAGDSEARLCLAKAEQAGQTIELMTWVPIVQWILEVCTGNDDREQAKRILDETERLGSIDCLVVAFRGYPPLLANLTGDPELTERAASVLVAANDWQLAQRAGIAMPKSGPRARAPLSRREQEILGLVSQGLTNKQIAKALYISEATVKVHVRHVLEKLNVRTRTEAAVQAEQFLDA